MIAQAVLVKRRVYNPVTDSYVEKVSWEVRVTDDNYKRDYESLSVDSRYNADRLCGRLNREFHPEWYL